jgi:hypothetical protein
LHLRMRICIMTSRRARTVLSTCSMSICMLASEPRACSTVSETLGLMGPAGASVNRRDGSCSAWCAGRSLGRCIHSGYLLS